MNIWEIKFNEELEKVNEEMQQKILEVKEDFGNDLAELTTKVHNLLENKISDEDMDQIMNFINDTGKGLENRKYYDITR